MTEPEIRQWWKYPASKSFPEGNPKANIKDLHGTDPAYFRGAMFVQGYLCVMVLINTIGLYYAESAKYN